jgi:outer membrane lipoprotein SlyB
MRKTMTAGLVLAVTAFQPLSAIADDCKVDCGIVGSVRQETREGKGSGLGAVAGGVAGGLLGHQIGGGTGKTLATIGGVAGGAYAGHQVEKRVKTHSVHIVTVNMDSGQVRTFEFAQQPPMIEGDRVHLVKNRPERYSGK